MNCASVRLTCIMCDTRLNQCSRRSDLE